MIRIRRGLDLDLPGAAAARSASDIEAGPPVHTVAVVGPDARGLRPHLEVKPGDRVRAGEPLFRDRSNPGAPFLSPGTGVVEAVHRGERRVLLSVVVRLEDDDASGWPVEGSGPGADPAAFDRDAARDLLVRAGLWAALRERPFGRVPRPEAQPRALFVPAMDTEPLAPDPAVVLDGRGADFRAGLELFARAADAPVRVCRAPGAAIDAGGLDGASVHEFAGPHPAGLPGTHMHFLDPAGPRSRLWVAGYRTVAAAGALLRTGRAPVDRVVALTGPMVARPRLVRTRVGASVDDLLRGGLADGPARVVAGSALSGRTAEGPLAYLGPDHRQVCVLSDAVRPRRLSWLRPAPRRPDWTTAAHGEPRPILPLRVFERVMPLDILPVPLLKALAVRDLERAVELGCLELLAEDLALLSYVDPGKGEFGADLEAVLDELAKGA